MKKIVLFLLLGLYITSCNYTDSKQKENLKNNSIEKIKFDSINQIKKDSIFRIDSIKIIQDSLLKIQIKKERKLKIQSTIKISNLYLSSPNSAGGCDITFYYINKSEKTIKYVTYNVNFYNNVNDLVDCDIRGGYSFKGLDTGPIRKNQSSGGVWDCAIYNWSATKIKMDYIQIEYMDGEKITISGDELKLIGLRKNKII